mgnify:FL=1|tara:strand:- start:12363 stop:13112 length:750 start_codon:yes stop_codon:yes gene_type:complete
MATTLSSATMTVRIVESIKLNGVEQGAINTRFISSINEISKRIFSVPTSEVTVSSFSTAVSTGTFVEGDVRYIRITNKDDTNFVYLVFKNEYNNEFCVKLDSGQSYIYNGDNNSGVIDTMLANQVALGFTEATGDTTDSSANITNITATNKIIPGLRASHDNAQIPSGSSVGSVTGGDSTDGYRGTQAGLVTRNATTGAETTSTIASHTSGSSDTNGTTTYSAGFGDLVEITAEADTASVDLEVFVASV